MLHLQGGIDMPQGYATATYSLLHHLRQNAALRVLSLTRRMRVRVNTMWHTTSAGACPRNLAGCSHVLILRRAPMPSLACQARL